MRTASWAFRNKADLLRAVQKSEDADTKAEDRNSKWQMVAITKSCYVNAPERVRLSTFVQARQQLTNIDGPSDPRYSATMRTCPGVALISLSSERCWSQAAEARAQ